MMNLTQLAAEYSKLAERLAALEERATAPTAPPSPSAPPRATVGRIVHFGARDVVGQLVARPAIIVSVWPDETVNVVQFSDGNNDGNEAGDARFWSGVDYSKELEMGCWTWPPR